MSELTQADQYLLERIRGGESEGWGQLVGRYEGRLLAFAHSRLSNASDAEDMVQETFISFLKSLADFRGAASIETYLFSILRRRIATHLRSRRVNVCMVQDTVYPAGDEPGWQVPSPDQTASWYVRRDEQEGLQRDALAEALRELVSGLKDSLDFKRLEVIELLFYSQLPNKDVARIAGLGDKQVALIKHRSVKKIQQQIAALLPGRLVLPACDALLTEIWEDQRLSCPKRSTIGRFLLGTLEEAWGEYVDFHLNRLGCRFCQANLEDLRRQTAGPQRRRVHDRIMQSTVGFLQRA